MRAIRDGASRDRKSRSALLGSRSALHEMRTETILLLYKSRRFGQNERKRGGHMIKCFLTELGQNMTWCKQSHYMRNGFMAVDWQIGKWPMLTTSASFSLQAGILTLFNLFYNKISTLKITMSLSVTSSLGENERE